MDSDSRRLAMLIDGDNANATQIKEIVESAEAHGEVIIRRVYGNWHGNGLSEWKKQAPTFGLLEVQQVSGARGKNSTDIALVIDAMDIIHSGAVNGFCLVSSDSDFTRLAIRIREGGMYVMGVGREDTPEAIKNACHDFVVTNDPKSQKQPKPKEAQPVSFELVELIAEAVKESTKPDGWAQLATVGAYIKKEKPGLKYSEYGPKLLSGHVEAWPDRFEVAGSGPSQKVSLKE